MNKFDESRVGYGQENPLIKKGAKGYFSDYRITLKSHVNILKGKELRELREIDLKSKFPYEDNSGYSYCFFYVVEEATTHRPYTESELLHVLGEMIMDKEHGNRYYIGKLEKRPRGEATLRIHIPSLIREYVWVTADKVFTDYTYEDGSPVGTAT